MMSDNVEERTGFHTISPDEAESLEAQLPFGDNEIEDLTNYFQLLNEESRLRILLLLNERELCVHDLTALLDMKQPAVSHQLSDLRKQGIIERRKDGRVVYYSATDHELNDLLEQSIKWLGDQ